MPSNHDDQLTIKEYLLGRLNEDNRHDFEQRLLTDDGFYDELLAGEEELIDLYLGGELNEQESEMFEKNFLVTSERQQKLNFAKVFKKYAAAHAGQEVQPRPTNTGSRSPGGHSFRRPHGGPWQLRR